MKRLSMELTLILGPMKSGKSFEFISYFMSLEKENIPFKLYRVQEKVLGIYLQMLLHRCLQLL